MDKLNKDLNAHLRKQDHIELAFKAQVLNSQLDDRFYYEPVIAGHPNEDFDISLSFLGKTMKAPIWVSSMTGGAKHAHQINHNLAKAVKEFGLGMGLGSCRNLLYDQQHFADFDLRNIIDNQPFYANLGIAQVEHQLLQGASHKIAELLNKLQVDGLIIHINPLQEWIQPEGDFFARPPIETIQRFIDHFPDTSLIIKEVGQGFGPKSLQKLLELPIDAIDFGAAGGTNFSKLEMLRTQPSLVESSIPLTTLGHSALEMIQFIKDIIRKTKTIDKELIISGGISNYLDGYYLISQSPLKSIYGQASNFLRHATQDYPTLQDFVSSQIKGYQLAKSLLTIKPII